MNRHGLLLVIGCIAVVATAYGGGAASGKDAKDPIVIGTANSLTGVLAPFELAINNGMDIAADEINAAGGVKGRKIKIIHVDAKSDLNLSATAALDVIEKGAQIVVPICDADYGAPGARAANAIGAEFAFKTKGWRKAYFLCDRTLEYTKVVCEAFKTRWKGLGGKVVGEDTFLQADVSIAAQVTRLVNSPKPDFVMLGSYPGGSPAIKQIRAAYDGPLMLSAAYSGTFWLKPTPHLSNVWVPAVGSSYGDDPRPKVNAFFAKYKKKTGAAALVDSYPLLGYSLVQSLAKAIEIAGTTDGKQLAKALETFRDVQLLAGPTTYTKTCHVPVKRSLLMIRYDDGKPRSTGRFVHPEKVPPYPC